VKKKSSREKKLPVKCKYILDGKCVAARMLARRGTNCQNKQKDSCCFLCDNQKTCEVSCLEPFPVSTEKVAPTSTEKVVPFPPSAHASRKWKYLLVTCLVGILVIAGTLPLGIPILSPVHTLSFGYGPFSGSLLVTVSPTFSFSGISRPFIVSVRGGSGSFQYAGESYAFTTPVGGKFTVHETRLVWGGAPITGIYIVAETELNIESGEGTVSPTKLVYESNGFVNWQTINVAHAVPTSQFDSTTLTLSLRYTFSVVASVFAGTRRILQGSIELGAFNIRIELFPTLFAIVFVLLLVTAVTIRIVHDRSKPKASVAPQDVSARLHTRKYSHP
jgi:hypothetical protein